MNRTEVETLLLRTYCAICHELHNEQRKDGVAEQLAVDSAENPLRMLLLPNKEPKKGRQQQQQRKKRKKNVLV